MDAAVGNNVAEIMDAKNPLFILYTSGSTGKPKRNGAFYSRLHGLYRLHFQKCIQLRRK